MTKTLFAVCDASPEDNLVGGGNHWHSLAMVLGHTIEELQLVRAYPGGRWKYKKWSKANKSYKSDFIDVAPRIKKHLRLLFAVSSSPERAIKREGFKIWCDILENPPLGEPNRKGKTRHKLGNFRDVDGKVINPFWMLEDQMAILGFYAGSIVGLTRGIDKKTNSTNNYRALWDKLHTDRHQTFPKAMILKTLTERLSSGHVTIDGVTAVSDKEPRDLLVDNIAGLLQEIRMNSDIQLSNQFDVSELKQLLVVKELA